jgi:hypothetical protein
LFDVPIESADRRVRKIFLNLSISLPPVRRNQQERGISLECRLAIQLEEKCDAILRDGQGDERKRVRRDAE